MFVEILITKLCISKSNFSLKWLFKCFLFWDSYSNTLRDIETMLGTKVLRLFPWEFKTAGVMFVELLVTFTHLR